jgi:hypothetical protein
MGRMKSKTKKRKMIRLLAAALTLAMAVSMLAVPASAAGASAARNQEAETAQQASGEGLNVKAAIGAVGIAAAVCLYWNPTARQKVAQTAQLALSDMASDAMILLRGVTTGAKQVLTDAAADAQEEWNRRKDASAAKEAKENEGETQAAETAETAEKTGTQGSATQTTTTPTQSSATQSSKEDAGESAAVIVKLGGTAAAKADN